MIASLLHRIERRSDPRESEREIGVGEMGRARGRAILDGKMEKDGRLHRVGISFPDVPTPPAQPDHLELSELQPTRWSVGINRYCAELIAALVAFRRREICSSGGLLHRKDGSSCGKPLCPGYRHVSHETERIRREVDASRFKVRVNCD